MAKSDVEKVSAVFVGISAGDIDLATQYINHKLFLQYNPYAADGVEGLAQFIRQSPRDQLQLTVIRALQDGPYVVTQAKGQRSGKEMFFDIFRFLDGLIVEHWAFSAPGARSNPGGQGCDLFAIHGYEFRKFSDHAADGHRSNAGNRVQQLGLSVHSGFFSMSAFKRSSTCFNRPCKERTVTSISFWASPRSDMRRFRSATIISTNCRLRVTS